MDRALDQLRVMAPSLAFLLAAVPFAALLDRLTFFEAVTAALHRRAGDELPVRWLWVLAAATTAVLNLDTTIVLLTPLVVRLARRADVDPVRLAVVPLVLAGLASSPIVVSNLTNLLGADRFGVDSVDLVTRFGLPTITAVTVGWWAYARVGPTVLHLGPPRPALPAERTALLVGGPVVVALLLAFVLGPTVGIDPWIPLTVAVVGLALRLGVRPWRSLPIGTAVAVAGVAATVAVVVPADALRGVVTGSSPWSVAGAGLAASVVANLVNNLPAFLLGANAVGRVHPATWGWWWGTNAFAVLLPAGALANLLWRRLLADEGHRVGLRSYVALVAPIVVPAALAGLAVLAIQPWT